MKNKKSRVLLIALAVIVAISAIGATAAYMFTKSQAVENNFTPASVTCEVDEQFDGEKKSSITVKNTSNIDAYVRVRLVSYWQDEEGNVVGKASPKLNVELAEGWVAFDNENNTYYYTKPVKAGETSPQLLAEPIILTERTEENGKTIYQVVEVFAEAIQADGVTDEGVSAVEYAWKTHNNSSNLSEWVQPQGAHDAYHLGDRVTHDGKNWISIRENNVWEPGTFDSGWEEI